MNALLLPEIPIAELAAAPPGTRCCRDAEIATTLRLAGIFYEGNLVGVQAATRPAAERLAALTGAARIAKLGDRWELHGVDLAPTVLRRLGLYDARLRPVAGLPPRVVSGPVCCPSAVWRATLLSTARAEVGLRRVGVAVGDVSLELAVALAGMARRLGARAEVSTRQSGERVSVPGHVNVARLLAAVGAGHAAEAWAAWEPAPAGPARRRSDNLYASNARRAAESVDLVLPELRRVIDAFGEELPPKLLAAGRLRLAHPDLTLEALARLVPPMTKDTIAGRIRRLRLLAAHLSPGPGAGQDATADRAA